MQLEIYMIKVSLKNEGQYKIKVMQRGPEKGSPESSDYDNGITEVFVEPGDSITVEGKFWMVEYTPNDITQTNLYSDN
jgi:hypothetical protein